VAESGEGRAWPADVIAALHRGSKIEAIRLLRAAWNVDLKEAKDHVDRYIAADPLLQRKYRATTVSGARGCLFWFILLVFVGYAAWQLLAGR
jgi:hypothetical protein